MDVHVPTPLRSYTANKRIVDAEGATLAQLVGDLDRRYPGFRFRIVDEQDHVREHVRLFVNQSLAQSLDQPLSPTDSVHIIMAISGG